MAMIPDERSKGVPPARMVLRSGVYLTTFLIAFAASAVALLWFIWLYPKWLYTVREPRAFNECLQIQIGMSRVNVLKVFDYASVVPGYEAEEKKDGDVLVFLRSDGSCSVELDPTGKAVTNKTFLPRSNERTGGAN